MKKKKAKKKGKTVAKRPAARHTAKKAKEPHPEKVRKEVSVMIETGAKKMAQAVIERAKAGELATVKYLFEMSGVFPKSKETEEGSPHEDSLAETLLHRCNIPLEPVNSDADDEPVEFGAPMVTEEAGDGAGGGPGKPTQGEVDAAVGTFEEPAE